LTAAGGVVGGGGVHAGAEHARVRVQDAASGHHPPEAGQNKEGRLIQYQYMLATKKQKNQTRRRI
jgi:hypothetical protein